MFAVAFAGSAPPEWVERLQRFVEDAYPPTLWYHVLAGAFRRGVPDPTTVQAVLDHVLDNAPDAPDAFRNPTAKMRENAAGLLRTKHVVFPGHKHGGLPGPNGVTSWGMAQRFAACLNLNMPDERLVWRGR